MLDVSGMDIMSLRQLAVDQHRKLSEKDTAVLGLVEGLQLIAAHTNGFEDFDGALAGFHELQEIAQNTINAFNV